MYRAAQQLLSFSLYIHVVLTCTHMYIHNMYICWLYNTYIHTSIHTQYYIHCIYVCLLAIYVHVCQGNMHLQDNEPNHDLM